MKILLAVDGSRYSRWATETLLSVPWVKRPDVVVLHVVDVGTIPEVLVAPQAAEAYRAVVAADTASRERTGKRLVARVAARLKTRCRTVTAVVANGRAADVIVDRARREAADLIVVGARGVGNVRRFLLGSVSARVVSHAPCSVLVVKRGGRAVRRVVLGADGSKASERAARRLAAWVAPGAVTVGAVYVWEYPVHPHPAGAVERMVDERYCRALKRAGIACRPQWVMGHPAERLVAIAARKRADLLVVGARGLSAVRRFLLGGVSNHIATHSHGSVLVVR
ncbi:MAG TPA: universal stress protein [Nitrospiria bacterium]|nr:universal stress protein [Nitrospiria bacterium]